MKKTLIALAALGAMAGAAHAQSTVTLYGVADAHFGQKSTTTNVAGVGTKLSQTVIDSGGHNGSRWGLKGAEDLGGGLKAIFQLESGFTIDNGNVANGATMFGRQAFVGLSGGFGSVTMGRQYTAYDALRGATNNTNDSSFATTGTVWGTGLADYAGRTNNSIAYTSPSFGGFSGAVVLGLGEDKTAAASASRNTSLNLMYANGPILAGYAYQQEKAVGGANSNKYHLFAGSYDFGVVKLVGAYNRAKDNTIKDKEYQLGLSAPFGAFTVYGGYTRAKTTVAATSSTASGYSLMGTYDLSKRTRLYTAYNNTKNNGAAVAGVYKTSALVAGVKHSF
ncbi:porin [Polaromonas aquatica]|uniref:porin n=1 Tax=Polaromonas aquatica TaxID=332657 RepID=UPI003D64B4F4